MDRPAAVVILAAGAGTRMKSKVPKVLNSISGRSLLGHAITAGGQVGAGRMCVVVRHERDKVAADALSYDPSLVIADQDEIPGTGRAVQCALDALEEAGSDLHGTVVITYADVPLLDGGTLTELVRNHEESGCAVTVLTAVVEDAAGYGRVVRERGAVARIVEHRDATAEEREINEINTGVYAVDGVLLKETLAAVGSANVQGEIYLTDVVGLAHQSGKRVQGVVAEDTWTIEGANDKVQLAQLAKEMNRRIVEDWMREGVTVIDPDTTWIDVDVELAPDVTILPNVQLRGVCRIEEDAVIGPDTTLTDCEVGRGAQVIRTHGLLAVIGADAMVGPFAYLRPGTDLGANGKIGTFVETKNAIIGQDSKVPHLSYVGDATIGEGSNIGAASVFVNYDGVTKHRTIVGDHCRMGSDNMYVAPVTIGDGAYSGAGTTLRRDVPPGALAINPSQQRNVEGWVEAKRPGTKAADAAAAARAAKEAAAEELAAEEPATGVSGTGTKGGASL
ncbi:MAG TPA: bifunctional UDP-N-acetylglucosamine diphosphorylase/glucosamine-1-phosphate N-acetyltransferase GlmU [Actinomycetaceae bacterium]|nr:bifunctional UDP-N-acetylglucosamine diphosphorylase/glucosamine-1-phosphate N-acetyltransferase GlmU [Actinomycetaceae bacterium]